MKLRTVRGEERSKSDRMSCFWWQFYQEHCGTLAGFAPILPGCCQRTAGLLVFWSPWPPYCWPGCWRAAATPDFQHLSWNHPPILGLIGKANSNSVIFYSKCYFIVIARFVAGLAHHHLRKLTNFGPRPVGSYANDVQTVRWTYCPHD